MINMSKYCLKAAVAIAMAALLSACGGDSSSSTTTTIPDSATVFYAHNLVFRNSTTLSTGYNAFGQLGTGNLANRNTAGYLSENLPFNGAATGGDHSVAFFNNSTVRSWGYNGFGQLGNNSTTSSNIPVKTVLKDNAGNAVHFSGVKAVAAGLRHSLALKNDDTLWAWGSNDSGQLGIDAALTQADGFMSKVPVQVTGGGASVLFNITAIAANAFHSLALADGKVWAWGLNKNRQLGIDPINTPESAAPVLVPGLPAAGIAGIAAGGAFNCAVANDNTLWTWGNNDFGQLGDNSTMERFTPVQVVTTGGVPLTNVVQAAAGLQHGLARLADGTVWAWGYNIFGQLGNNTKDPSLFAIEVFKSPGVHFNATDIRAFGSSAMALEGKVWYAWGDNSYGQLGTGGGLTQLVPVRMSGF